MPEGHDACGDQLVIAALMVAVRTCLIALLGFACAAGLIPTPLAPRVAAVCRRQDTPVAMKTWSKRQVRLACTTPALGVACTSEPGRA